MLIGEIVAKSGLSKDTIRHYEALGLLHSTPKQAGSRVYRDYDDSTWERLSLIAMAKRVQFSLREIAETLNRILADDITREERQRLLWEKVGEVDAKIADLRAARDLLAQFADAPDKPVVDAQMKALGIWVE